MLAKPQNIIFGQVLFEFVILNVCLLVVLGLIMPSTLITPLGESYAGNILQLALVFNLSWGLILLVNGDANFYTSSDIRKRGKYLLLNSFIFVGVTYILLSLFKLDPFDSTTLLMPIFLFAAVDLLLNTSLIRYIKVQSPDAMAPNILIVGANGHWKQVSELGHKIQREGYQVAGVLDNTKLKKNGKAKNGKLTNGHHQNGNTLVKSNELKIIGQVYDLDQILDRALIDKIFIYPSALKEEEVQYAVDTANYHGIRVNLVPDAPKIIRKSFRPATLRDFPIIELRSSPLDRFNNTLLKKVFDFLFALAVIIMLSPVFLILSLLILLDSRGPILYCPLRKGQKGQTFRCYKFRTMTECDDPVNGTRSTVKNDPRVTRVGKYLRKWDLDELPQFFNVLKGDMSVAGPRPHRVFLQNDFRKIINDYMVRHYVKPGITGWAQVNGWRGPTQTEEQKRKRIEHDLWYIENWSFWLDIKIVFLTVFGRKTRKNAF